MSLFGSALVLRVVFVALRLFEDATLREPGRGGSATGIGVGCYEELHSGGMAKEPVVGMFSAQRGALVRLSGNL